MNKRLYFILGIILIIISSCASTPQISISQKSIFVSSESGSEAAIITVEYGWKKGPPIKPEPGFSNFVLSITNNTKKMLKIIWDESWISYGTNTDKIVFFENFTNKTLFPTIIQAEQKFTVKIISNKQVVNLGSGGYTFWPIASSEVSINLYIEVDGDKDLYIVTIK